MSFFKKKTVDPSLDPYESMSDNEINQKYEEVLKELLFPPDKIQQMIQVQKRQGKIIMIKSKAQQPKGSTPIIIIKNLRSGLTKEHIQEMRVCLSMADESWLREFLNLNGVQSIMEAINSIINLPQISNLNMELLEECAMCYKAMMNNSIGIKGVVDYPGSMSQLILILDDQKCKDQFPKYFEAGTVVLDLLSALCLIPEEILENGQKIVLDAIDYLRYITRESLRFQGLIQQLGMEGTPESFKAKIVALINVILCKNEYSHQRIKLRMEFNQCGLDKIITVYDFYIYLY
ncbi:MAG: putative actin binding protein [Streblomastix strix]|uniref:Putative actin binding protein n=1 Tax=Streblomastix strix TaxID=222440 RepID=A0A5J4X642_9EUKA|nr:MAG: putative actin binding protein [Streblomastix strix]